MSHLNLNNKKSVIKTAKSNAKAKVVVNKTKEIQTSNSSETTDHLLIRSINIRNLQDQVIKDDSDMHFEAINSNLSNEFRLNENIKWLKSNEILTNPECQIRLGVYNLDVISEPVQNQLGDCWFVSTCHALFFQSNIKFGLHLLKNIFPNEENELFKSESIVCRFYVKGCFSNNTIDIHVDSRLPVNIQKNNELIYGGCKNKNNLWFAYLEKAYAKLYGSNYENIIAGVPEEAFLDLTGAMTLYLNPQVKSDADMLLEKLSWLKSKNMLIACADTVPTSLGASNKVKSHSFALIDFIKNSQDFLVKLKNPWSSSKLFNKDLKIANQYKSDNETDIVLLKYKDFTRLFGATSLILKIPYFSNEGIIEFKVTTSACEQITNMPNLINKNNFVTYLTQNAEFYILEIDTLSSCEILFNLSQFVDFSTNTTQYKHNEITFNLIEMSKNGQKFKANYSSRFESNRIGRTLSKILKLNQKEKKFYLICFLINSNLTSTQNENKINYLFRSCVLTENDQQRFSVNKCNNLVESQIELDLNSCFDCNRIFLKEFKNTKIFTINEKLYCADCHSKKAFKPSTNSFASLIDDYSNL